MNEWICSIGRMNEWTNKNGEQMGHEIINIMFNLCEKL